MKAIYRDAWRAYFCAALHGNIEALAASAKHANENREGDTPPVTVQDLAAKVADGALNQERHRFVEPGQEGQS